MMDTRFLLLFAAFVSLALPRDTRAQLAPAPFTQTVIVTGAGFSQVLTFGQAAEATDGFDRGLDLPAPPAFPAPSFDARLMNADAGFATDFLTDVRAPQGSGAFTLFVRPESTDEPEVTITWDPLLDFPGLLTLSIGGETANLVLPGSLTFPIADLDGITGTITFENVVSVETESGDVPALYRLHANYPNPFNPATTISFTVPEPSHVRLSIFDTAGREVEVLADRRFAAGTFQVQWKAGSYASGVYFYTMRVGAFAQAKKLVLLK